MAEYGLIGVHKPAKVRTTIPAKDNPPMPDLIGRRFAPAKPDVAGVGDITYIRFPRQARQPQRHPNPATPNPVALGHRVHRCP